AGHGFVHVLSLSSSCLILRQQTGPGEWFPFPGERSPGVHRWCGSAVRTSLLYAIREEKTMVRRFMPLLAALLALGAAAPARALTTITTNVTLPNDPTYGNSITGDVDVTSNAVLTINAGGSVTGSVYPLNTSTVNVSGGSIGDSLRPDDTSTVNVSG